MIAIDGPAGAGKSTVAGILCRRLSLRLLDTGAMYRALALLAGSVDDPEWLAKLAAEMPIRFGDGIPPGVWLGSEDVSARIRTLEIGQRASQISVLPAVRRELVRRQRELAADGGFVLEGRDVTMVVAPEADLKVFLTASIEERARRRWLEMRARGETPCLQDVVRDVVQRDHRDYTRSDSPLELAEDAHIVESYGITAEQVAERIESLLARVCEP